MLITQKLIQFHRRRLPAHTEGDSKAFFRLLIFDYKDHKHINPKLENSY